MGRRLIMSQRAISRATADMNGRNASPETDYSDPKVMSLVAELFEKRNAPGIPPHEQRLFRQMLLQEHLLPTIKSTANHLGHSLSTQHQAKPRGRSHHAVAFRMA